MALFHMAHSKFDSSVESTGNLLFDGLHNSECRKFRTAVFHESQSTRACSHSWIYEFMGHSIFAVESHGAPSTPTPVAVRISKDSLAAHSGTAKRATSAHSRTESGA